MGWKLWLGDALRDDADGRRGLENAGLVGDHYRWLRMVRARSSPDWRSVARIAGGTTRHSGAPAVLPLCYYHDVPVRKKRSISIPPDLDASIEEAARVAGTTYSGWLAATARKELTLRAGLAAVAAYERADGEFNDEEIAEAEAWAQDAVARGRRSSARSRRTA